MSYLQRERELHFSQVGTNPKVIFFQEDTNPKELGTFPKAFIAVETVQSVLHLLGMFFEEGHIGYILLGTHFERCTVYRSLGMIFKVCWAQKSRQVAGVEAV